MELAPSPGVVPLSGRRRACSNASQTLGLAALGGLAALLGCAAFLLAVAAGPADDLDAHELPLRRLAAAAEPEDPAANCNGMQEDLRPCETGTCHEMHLPVDCVWDDWGNWEECECDGTQQRSRAVKTQGRYGGKLCTGDERQLQPCNPTSPACHRTSVVDCLMGDWGDWSDCTRSCDGGQRYHTREIVTQPRNGGQVCQGDLEATEVCEEQGCPGQTRVDCMWGSWTSWSVCSTTCGGGEKSRTRSIAVSPQYGGKLCDPVVSAETTRCAEEQCDASAADCLWSTWGVWSACSKTCGGGEKYRIRSIAREAQPGGAGCQGVFEDYGTCNEDKCPRGGQDCLFADWQVWSACSATCMGHHSRTRAIAVEASDGGQACEGSTMEFRPCNDNVQCIPEDVNCLYGNWGSWSTCSRTCSGGTKERRRSIVRRAQGNGKQCAADLQELERCNLEPCTGMAPVDCQWQDWTPWSVCTVTCGQGQFRRHRSIVLEAKNGGRACDGGSSIEMGVCDLGSCEEKREVCEWATWGQWTDCERSGVVVMCGGGQQKRSRTTKFVTELVGGNSSGTSARRLQSYVPPPATGSSESRQSSRKSGETKCEELQDEIRHCAEVDCEKAVPVNCNWGPWSAWSSCPCSGVQERHRVIANYAEGGGKPCQGAEVESSPCHADCGVEPTKNCTFSPWTEWSACPVTCGGGHLTRFRTITQYPQGSGLECEGKTEEELPCNPNPCPEAVDCKWGMWGEYSACSMTCGGGQKSRSRTVEQVAENGGKPCNKTISMMVTECNTQACPSGARDCEFSAWNEWQTCDAVCGGGRQHRTRVVMVEATEGGAACDGLMQQFRACGTAPCKQNELEIPCVWGDWTEWSACNALCNGHQDRSRSVAQFASNGGAPCEGGERVVRGCNLESTACMADAPVDCQFQDWRAWSTCSHNCDGGQHSRMRGIQVHAQNYGRECEGALQQTQPCNTAPCPGNVRVDCAWSLWGDWSACTKSCDGGQMTRHRAIDVEATGGGAACAAKAAMEITECNPLDCFGAYQVCGWSGWGSWDVCSKSCGGGQQQRSRQRQWVPKPGALGEAGNATIAGVSPGSVASSRRLYGLTFSSNENKCVGSQKITRPCGTEACDNVIMPIPCRWGVWGEWGPCSCEGLQERERDINSHAKNGGLACSGSKRESRRCPLPDKCSEPRLDCGLGPWSDWSECTASCSGGQRYHTRSVAVHAQAFGAGCEGGLEAVEACNTQSCDEAVDCQYTDWSPWNLCSHSCGGGQRTRSRAIYVDAENGGKPCEQAALAELGTCSTEECVPSIFAKTDCVWTTWQQWAECSASCGVGMTYRNRKVATEAGHGGTPCNGVFEEFRNCTKGPCTPNAVNCRFGGWSAWSSCSDKCTGHQERSRSIAVFANGTGQLCQGASREVHPCEGDGAGSGVCNSAEESLDCVLGTWSDWSDCSHACGGGQRFQSRQVVQQARGGGKLCDGELKHATPCNVKACPGEEPVDCVWGDWEEFSRCTASCDGGQMHRHRPIKVEAKNGGIPCEASETSQVVPCNTQACHGSAYCSWSTWTTWSQCSASCGGGQKKRHRDMVSKVLPPPPPQGAEATGLEARLNGDVSAVAAGPMESLVLRHRLQLCVLAGVGAVSLAVMFVNGVRKVIRHVEYSEGSENAPYMPLGTQDPATLGIDEDEECPMYPDRSEPWSRRALE